MLAVDIFLAGVASTFASFAKLGYAIFIFVAIYGLYAYLFLYMRKNRMVLDKPSVRNKIGNLYADLRTETTDKTPNPVEFYSFAFFLRRILFGFLRLFSPDTFLN